MLRQRLKACHRLQLHVKREWLMRFLLVAIVMGIEKPVNIY